MTPSPSGGAPDQEGPTLLTRLAAKLRGEVPGAALESFRMAGGAVYPMLLAGCERASGDAALGRHPWIGPPGPGDELLAVWAALVLQVVGESLLAEDYASSAATRGYLPPVTAEQAWACFDRVGPWLDRARQCHADPASIQADIEAAARAHRIVPAGRGGPPLVFHACPWGPIWLVVRPVHLGGQRLEVMTEFAYEVSAAEARSTGTFVRRIVRGPFVRTDRMGYEVRPA